MGHTFKVIADFSVEASETLSMVVSSIETARPPDNPQSVKVSLKENQRNGIIVLYMFADSGVFCLSMNKVV